VAFSEFELARIGKIVGGLCHRRSPPELKDQLSVEYEIKLHDVVIIEKRSRWDGSPGHTKTDVAKIKLVRTVNEWRLFWMRADLRWHSYQPLASSRYMEDLVDEVDADPYGCFWG